MILPVVMYGHPVLRQKGAPISDITPEIRQLIEDMIETMYEAQGVGLAAQQVGRALQLTVIDVAGIKDRPSWMEIQGKRVELDAHMPLVLLNPQVTGIGSQAPGPEGCLSFPEIFAEIKRPESVEVRATLPTGETLDFRCGGLLARAVQHETDHLNGILFIDRMDTAQRAELQAELEALQTATKEALKKIQK